MCVCGEEESGESWSRGAARSSALRGDGEECSAWLVGVDCGSVGR